MGDWNARIQTKNDDAEQSVGPHTFDKKCNKLAGQSQGATDNRERCITFCEVNDMVLSNTFFDKPDYKLCTYRELGTDPADWNNIKRSKYEQIDYIATANRWRNTIKNSESDMTAHANTNHYPLWATVQ
eukprot:2991161-Karenia_brevis.AAC.1